MDLADQMENIAAKVPRLLNHLETEEAAKNALVMPFINALGYNVFDPTEVLPEFTADVGTKKGEKVDYAIFVGGELVMLIECKKTSVNLDDAQYSQLFRYFHTTKARVGMLTNGIVYRFYTDLEDPNKMDEKPFLEIDLMNLKRPLLQELKKLSKGAFDLDKLLSAASDLKYSKAIKQLLAQQFVEPSDEFVKFFASEVHPGKRITQNVLLSFRSLVTRALTEFVNERLNARLQTALEQESKAAKQAVEDDEVPEEQKSDIVTTEEEVEGYRIVKAILRATVDPGRVAMRDAKSYCSILLDDNNRKPICRLRFNNPKRLVVGVFDKKKKEAKHSIECLDDIYNFGDQLVATAKLYDGKSSNGESAEAE